MKNYTITVNGTAYAVTVEETAAGSAPAAAPAPAPAAAPAPAPAAPAPAPAAPVSQGSAGSVEVTTSVPGKVLSVPAKVGDAVKAGDTVILLESMKMEIAVVAPQDGTVASIEVAAGAQVNAGDVLATMN